MGNTNYSKFVETIMKIIKLTKGLETIVSDEDYDYLNQYTWYAAKVKEEYYAAKTHQEALNILLYLCIK